MDRCDENFPFFGNNRLLTELYEVCLLNNKTAYEKNFILHYFTIECSSSLYYSPLVALRSIRFLH